MISLSYMPHRSRAPWRTASLIFLIAATVGAGLIRGGVDLSIQVGACALVVAAFLASIAAAHRRRMRISLLALALCVPVATMLFQLIPLPPGVLRWLSPNAHELLEGALRPLALYPSWRPLSLDPAATAREILKGVACVAAAAAAVRLCRKPDSRRVLLMGLALAGTTHAIIVLSAAAVGAEPLLEPRVTFVNPNHLAALLNLSAFIALGLAAEARDYRRSLWLAAA